MKRILRPVSRFLVAISLFLAVASSGFAHHFPSSEGDTEVVAYLKAIGIADDFCGDFDGSDHSNSDGCDVCSLITNALLADAPTTFSALQPVRRASWVLAIPSRFAVSHLDLSKPTRGPPSV